MTGEPSAPAHAVEGIAQRELVVGTGRSSRSAIVLEPASFEGRKRTIVSLHGSGSTAEAHIEMADLRSMAARGWIVVVPRAVIPLQPAPDLPAGLAWGVPGVPLPGETAPRTEVDDEAFVTGLVRWLPSHFSGNVAPGVHLSGYSGGARLASRVAAQVPEVVTLSCVAGLRLPVGEGRHDVRVLAIHGRDDPVNPYEGGSDRRWDASAPEAAEVWATRLGAARQELYTDPRGAARVTDYLWHDGNVAVRLIALPAAGHGWPGSTDPVHLGQFGHVSPFRATDAIHCWAGADARDRNSR